MPDVHTSGLSFSNIFFTFSPTTPLQFAIDSFTPPDTISLDTLGTWQQYLDLFTATEIGVRSEDGNLDTVMVVRLFLDIQVARIKRRLGHEGDPRKGRSIEELIGELADEVLRSTYVRDRRLLKEILLLDNL